MSTLRGANLALSFLLELAMLVAFAYWGYSVGSGVWGSVLLGLLIAGLAAVFWGMFMAPKAKFPVREPWHTLLALMLFGLAAAALWVTGHPAIAATFAILVLVNQGLKHLFFRSF